MKKKIYFDLDGVLRSLAAVVFGFNPPAWDWEKDNKDLVSIINEDLSLLVSAPKTKYLGVAEKMDDLTILTCQPDKWKPYTEEWIHNNLPGDVNLIYAKSFNEKLKYLKNGEILIEDFPFFSDYSKIAIIDYPYNQNVVNCLMRIREPGELAGLVLRESTRETDVVSGMGLKRTI